MDKYTNFARLSAAERLGEDYVIQVIPRNSSFAIIAPHGGGIERGTAEVPTVTTSQFASKFGDYRFTTSNGNSRPAPEFRQSAVSAILPSKPLMAPLASSEDFRRELRAATPGCRTARLPQSRR
jgi:hypothetical protein